MSLRHPGPSVRSLPLLGLLALAAPLAAQIPIGGNQSGTLFAGIYVSNATITVPLGQTLTLNPGVIIKFTNSAHALNVVGTVLSNGTVGNPVILTAYADDSAGGDTNGNGPSSGSPIAWQGMVFASTASASVLNYTDLRYGGGNFVSNIELNSASPTLSHCVIRNNYTHGMDLNGNSLPTVTNCTFSNNGGYAIENVPLMALPGLLNNAATGNPYNIARVTVGAVTSNLTLTPASMLGGAITADAAITVPAGLTLTFAAGVVSKLMNSGVAITMDGTLLVNGTAGNPVVFTGFADDSAGGDTNNNGLSSASPTAWQGLVFNGTGSASSLFYADIRYGGANFVSNVELNSSNPTLSHCVIRNDYTHGMDLNSNSFPTVTNCTFSDNGGYAIENVPVMALPGLLNNAASGNGVNIAHVTVGAVTSNLTITTASMLGGAITSDVAITVSPNATLTVGAGVVCKLMNSGVAITLDGTLLVNGTAGNPVVFTGFADDSAGGDTNNNGLSSASPTAWQGLVFNGTGSASSLFYADIRYGGANFVSNVELNSSNPTLSHCVIRNNYTHGMDLNGNSFPKVTECTFTNNGNNAVERADLAATGGFHSNSASGNGGNYINITSGNVAQPTFVPSDSMMGGAMVVSTSITVQPSGTLYVGQGVIFKFTNTYAVTCAGAMWLLGTGHEPIVFTAFADDSFGGDTNNNGLSSGGWTAWQGMTCTNAAGPSLLRHVRIRYTGAAFVPGLTCASGNVGLRSVRVDNGYNIGFDLQNCAFAYNLVAFGCNNFGIQLAGGSFPLVHATSAANTTGIRREAAWTGQIWNSIARANTTNLSNVAANTFLYSNGGFAGSNGCIDTDPQFVNQSTGDLRLTASSPGLGGGDLLYGFAVTADHEQNSRILDHTLAGVLLPDMGAYELCQWDMTVAGNMRIGGSVTYTVTGAPGESLYLLGILDGTQGVAPWGILLCGTLAPGAVVLPVPVPLPVGTPLALPVPANPGLVGLVLGMQTMTYANGNLLQGSFTRLHEVLIRQ